MLNRMIAEIKFNREIDPDKDFVSPGGYHFLAKGKKIDFDFMNCAGYVNKKDRSVLHIEGACPDVDSFDCIKSITADDFRNIDNIDDFYVHICGDDLMVKSILSIELEFYHETSDEYEVIKVSDSVLDKYNNKEEDEKNAY